MRKGSERKYINIGWRIKKKIYAFYKRTLDTNKTAYMQEVEFCFSNFSI